MQKNILWTSYTRECYFKESDKSLQQIKMNMQKIMMHMQKILMIKKMKTTVMKTKKTQTPQKQLNRKNIEQTNKDIVTGVYCTYKLSDKLKPDKWNLV